MALAAQENIGSNHLKLSITISKEDYYPSFEKALKNYAKNATIPGFRKGMVPVGMIKKQYGMSVFTEEILRKVSDEVEKLLTENKLEILGRPLPIESNQKYNFDYNNPSEYVFEYEVGLRPSFDLPLLSGSQSVDIHKVIVSDDMLREELERLQYKAGEMKDADEVNSTDNIINITFTAVGQEGDTDPKKLDNSLLVNYFVDAVQQQLMGKKTGDLVRLVPANSFIEKVTPALLKDLQIEPSDTTEYDMTIEKIAIIEKPEVNKEFFEKIYPGRSIETEEGFMSELRSEVEAYWAVQSRNKLHNDLFERLVHETTIDLPVSFLKNLLKEGNGNDQNHVPKSEEQVEKEFPGFEHQLRWQLITDKIIEENKISVSNDELEEGTRAQLFNYFGQMAGGGLSLNDAEWIEPLIKKQLSDKKFRTELYERIITDKLFNHIESKVNMVEKEIDLNTFVNLPTAHHHHH